MRKTAVCLAVALACAGAVLIVVSQHTHRWAPPPAPPASAGLALPAADGGSGVAAVDWQQKSAHPLVRPVPSSASAGPQPAGPPLDGAPMGRSLPASVRIPAIGVDARIIPLGLGPDGIVNVPLLSTPYLTSWFDGGVTPGQIGPAVLFGHVDSAYTGPAVFYRLGDLRPGNLVYVTREDRLTAVFQVDAVDLYSEWDFPDQEIYGSTGRPVLRLVTCGGQFDTQTHLYLDRTVAWARYVGQLG
jgi:hypothetical protein